MTLRTCGTVIAQEHDRVIVRIEQERCTNCTGCVRFSFPKTVSAIGSQSVGERVTVRTSSTQLSLASILVFGVPVFTLAVVVLVWGSILLTGVALSLSLFVVYVSMRYARLRKFLKVHAESI